ncbi:Peptidase_S8 domain-containing protein [Trichoderma simmonsii]|uniref:Peptidase_S8 domain-containing protein n=1 Tax=Trichoderma simmonsii TaxID=1491479 RepID=A0A8G0LM08_9HYPO|nr:Peptidase_S8 domain-containing protein [Trichoderma simmonsii]
MEPVQVLRVSTNAREPTLSLQRAQSFGIREGHMEPKKQNVTYPNDSGGVANKPTEYDKKSEKKIEKDEKAEKKAPVGGSRVQRLRNLTKAQESLADELFEEELPKTAQEIFRKNYAENSEVLSEQGFNNLNLFDQILNRLAEEAKETPALIRDPPSRVREFIQYLVISHPQVICQSHDEGNQTRLLERALKKCKPLAFDVISLIVSDEDLQALEETCPYQVNGTSVSDKNCALSQFYLPGPLRTQFGKQQGPKRCLHDLVDQKRFVSWASKYKDQISKAVELPEKHKDGYETWLHIALEDQTAFTTTRTKDEMEDFHKSFLSLIGLCPDTDPKRNLLLFCDSDGRTPLHRAIDLFRHPDIDYTRLSQVIEVLVRRCPESIYAKAQYKDAKQSVLSKTPYRLLKDIPITGSNEKRKEAMENVDRLLKHVCIRSSRTKTEKQKYLHEKLADAPEIHLDLAKVIGSGKKYMDERAQKVKVQLDTALEYVSLPQYRMEQDNISTEINAIPEKPIIDHEKKKVVERNPHVAIFQWLKEKKVEKIFRVSVEDREQDQIPHTDMAIHTWLAPFDIEIWDWRKYDISSETILKGAANTRELHLYWSGNVAVMQSWACKKGLARLKKVQSITIVLAEKSMETEEVCQAAFDNFKEKFLKRRKNDVKKENIKLRLPQDSNHRVSVGQDSSTKGSTNDFLASEPVWIRKMQEMIDLLFTFKKVPREDVVKIALIDKGVDRENPEVLAIERGQSFYHGGRVLGHEETWDPEFREWDARPPIHGTQMAICIQKICPMARLYVARMDDSRSDTQEFTLESAINAINWAKEMGVNIISMSWSFKAKGEDYGVDEIANFKRTIAEAKADGILLFASLNDMEGVNIDDYYPCGLSDVFKIGSATKWGDKASHSRTGSDFILPGKDISLPDIDGLMKEVSGSSIATAFAAGLAGLVLYALSTHLNIEDEVEESLKMDRLKQAKSREGMNTIFNILSGNRQGLKTNDVWVSLDDKFPEKPDKGDPGPDIKDFIKSIVPK